MWPNPQETTDLVTFTEEILNEKLHFCAINLIPTNHDPSDPKAQNKWFFSFQISWINCITDPSIQTNRPLMSSYKPPPALIASIVSHVSMYDKH